MNKEGKRILDYKTVSRKLVYPHKIDGYITHTTNEFEKSVKYYLERGYERVGNIALNDGIATCEMVEYRDIKKHGEKDFIDVSKNDVINYLHYLFLNSKISIPSISKIYDVSNDFSTLIIYYKYNGYHAQILINNNKQVFTTYSRFGFETALNIEIENFKINTINYFKDVVGIKFNQNINNTSSKNIAVLCTEDDFYTHHFVNDYNHRTEHIIPIELYFNDNVKKYYIRNMEDIEKLPTFIEFDDLIKSIYWISSEDTNEKKSFEFIIQNKLKIID